MTRHPKFSTAHILLGPGRYYKERSVRRQIHETGRPNVEWGRGDSNSHASRHMILSPDDTFKLLKKTPASKIARVKQPERSVHFPSQAWQETTISQDWLKPYRSLPSPDLTLTTSSCSSNHGVRDYRQIPWSSTASPGQGLDSSTSRYITVKGQGLSGFCERKPRQQARSLQSAASLLPLAVQPQVWDEAQPAGQPHALC